MRTLRLAHVVGLFAVTWSASVLAQDLRYELGELQMGITATVTTGATWRLQGRDNDLIGKLNVPGQQHLCDADDCMSLQSNPMNGAPNQRLVDAKGSYGAGNTDNGNLNYDKHDIVIATTRITPTFTFAYEDWSAKFSGVLFYDPVNDGRNEYHPNTRFQPSRTERSSEVSRYFARGGEWREAYVTRTLRVADRDITLTLGNQRILWGESVLTPLNTLNSLMAPDAVMSHMPGFELRELYRPVPAFTVAGEVFDGLAAEAFYQWHWVPAIADPAGSFFSTNDIVGGGKTATLGLGQYAEDPNRQFRPAGLTGLISSSSRTVPVLSSNYGRPSNGGQYGLQLKYFASDFLGGTEFGGYYANYHSRLPYISAISANASCTRNAPIQGNFATAFVTCLGFHGSINPIGGLEPVPVDSAKIFLEYPEDIHMFGVSFNTNLGPWSLAGEYSFRPNMPLQIGASDVVFAALAPAFPSQDIPVPAGVLPGVQAPYTLPGHRRIAPDFLSVYRGFGTNGYGPNETVHGFERFKVGQFSLLGIHIFGPNDNPFGADQIQMLVEVSGTQIFGLPDISQLQLDGTGNRSHYSAGADGTGGEPDSLRINPTQQTYGAATAFSWGYRVALKGQYSNAIGNISLYPTILIFHDLGGVSPATIDNYVSGRKQVSAQLDAELTQRLSVGGQYQWFFGAGRNNQRIDRDNVGMYVRYSF